MTDPLLQAWSRYIAIDIHKHYLRLGASMPTSASCSRLVGSSCHAGRSGRRPICFTATPS
jgi:hypothetical protein